MKKGISLVSLGIIVVILTIILSVVVITSSDSVNNMHKVRFVTEFIQVETATEKYYINNNIYPGSEKIQVEFTASESNQFAEETIIDNKVNLLKINLSVLGVDEATYGAGESQEDFYAVSETTGKVYYVKGFNYQDKIYYRVTEELNKDYE
ncbi:MAG: hypothetical protein IKV94_04150 [Clostridia bacterium]|nr:hypothetical protein [Clostridia bacterium]